METFLLSLIGFGVVCIAGAIVGGGLQAFGATLPVLRSTGRQQLLALFGALIIAASAGGLAVGAGGDSGISNNPGGGSNGPSPSIPTTSLPTRTASCPAEVTLSSASAPRGGDITINGSCFESGERVDLRVHVEVVGSAIADTDGRFQQTVTIPQSAPPPGFPTSIAATGRSSIKTASAPFTTSR